MTSVKVKSKKQKPTNHRLGNWYQEVRTGNIMVLAQTSPHKVSMINVKDGNRYHEAVVVEDLHDISSTEMEEICQSREFKLIESITITED